MSTATSTVDDLKDALKSNLDASGSLQKIKAKIRGDIFQALRDSEVRHMNQTRA